MDGPDAAAEPPPPVEGLLTEAESLQAAAARLGTEPGSLRLEAAEVRPLAGLRAGFMGDHLKVKLRVRLESAAAGAEAAEGAVQELRFFAKSAPLNVPLHLEYVSSTGFFGKETAFYADVLPQLRAAQGDGGLDRWVPHCYLTRPDLLLLEDLTERGFRPWPPREPMDEAACGAALAELARFHAASIVLEARLRAGGEPRGLGELHPRALVERSGSSLRADATKGWFQAGVRSALPLVERLPRCRGDPELCRTVRQRLPAAFQVMNDIVKTSDRFRNTVSHGDIWASNILVRERPERGWDVRLVDLQIVRYAPPACDVHTLLHLMTERPFRASRGEHMLQGYYSELAAELRRRGLAPEAELPESEFRESCEFYRPLGPTLAAICHQLTLLPAGLTDRIFRSPERFAQFMLENRSAEILHQFDTDPLYRHRLTEAMDEFIDTCVL